MPAFADPAVSRDPAGDVRPALTRRRVLRGAAGAGAAGVAVTALGAALPAASASRPAASERSPQAPADSAEAIVAHVVDVATGEIDLYHGTTHTRLRDRALAARLAGATRR
jgi:hypothetical protein